jgi:SAM-dependent methyltransferase
MHASPVVDRRRLRTTFDEVPELYDRARPAYPAAALDDLAALARLSAGSRVLEIGCGTGKATVPLARRGLELVCVELGPALAAVARRNLAGFANVEVVNAAFETWEPGDAGFDAAVAFTAWHWIDPEVAYAKAARVLRPHGSLAVLATKHVLPEDGDTFFADVQEDYDAVVPSEDNRPPGPPDEVPDNAAEIASTGHFATPAVRRYLWDVVYSADEYVAVLDTYSGHRSLEERARRKLYERIRRRIESRPEPTVRKTYLGILHVAPKTG